jgi:hypothetical protein
MIFFCRRRKMKNIKGFTLGLVLGLSIAVAGIAYAQTNTQSDQNKKAECCCVAMDCCKGDSCPMMKDGAKKDGANNHAASADKDGCCGCCGDSCQMMKKDGAKNHATSADKESCCGDSCQMMKKDSAKTGTTTATATGASDKHECCCCGDSCDMKHNKHANMKGKS